MPFSNRVFHIPSDILVHFINPEEFLYHGCSNSSWYWASWSPINIDLIEPLKVIEDFLVSKSVDLLVEYFPTSLVDYIITPKTAVMSVSTCTLGYQTG
jgi:hypothetical protein